MKNVIRMLPVIALLMLPTCARAQKAGQIVCGPRDAYSYLYSSMATMEVSSKVGCGEIVKVLDRSDNFVRVQTENGAVGYVAPNSISFIKNGTVLKAAPAATHYDRPEAPAKPSVVALHNWAAFGHGYSLYRNDKNTQTGQEITTRSWELTENGKSKALVLTTYRKGDGSPALGNRETSTMLYSESAAAAPAS